MKEFNKGIGIAVAIMVVPIIFMFIGATANETDFKRWCEKSGHYQPLFGNNIECKTTETRIQYGK